MREVRDMEKFAKDRAEHKLDPIEDVYAERRRQIDSEGWTPEHDDAHADFEMARAAASYALATSWTDEMRDGPPPSTWPWDQKWWKPQDRRRDLVRAAALILAEIERLDRLAQPGDAA